VNPLERARRSPACPGVSERTLSMSLRLKGTAALIISGSLSEEKVEPPFAKASPRWFIATFLIEQPLQRIVKNMSTNINTRRRVMV
jgi:hypothetical protein